MGLEKGSAGQRRSTPVIFVTSHSDYENCERTILSGGNDVISKPILPIELAVKALTHLMKAQSRPAVQK